MRVAPGLRDCTSEIPFGATIANFDKFSNQPEETQCAFPEFETLFLAFAGYHEPKLLKCRYIS